MQTDHIGQENDTGAPTPVATNDVKHYNPSALLDAVARKLAVRDDAALARTLELSRLLIEKIRQRRQRVGASILQRMHELSGFTIPQLKSMMGERRTKYRVGGKDTPGA